MENIGEKMKPGSDYVGIVTPFYCHDGDGNIVMQKRGEKARDEHGRWDPGSGKLEKGLTLKENVKKEVREEYNCECEIQESLPPHGIFREQNGEKTHWLAIPFFVRVDRDEVENGEPHKFDEIKWFPIENLPENLHTGFADSFEKYRDIFEKIIGRPEVEREDIERIFRDIEELKHKERNGWKNAGVESPADTISSHSMGAAVLGYILAKSEGLDAEKIATMLIFHDFMMARMPDLTPEDEDYSRKPEMEQEVLEKMKNEYPEVASKIFEMIEEVQENKTVDAKLAKKADKLDTLMQAKSYSEDTDEEITEEFIESFQEYFGHSDSADNLFRAIEEAFYSRSGL